MGAGLNGTCNHGGAGKWREEHSKYFPESANVVILPDNDDPGRKHGEQVAEALRKRGCNVKLLLLPGLPPKGDVTDWLDAGHTKDELLTLVADTSQPKPPGLRALTAIELLQAEIPPREEILSPWLLSQSLNMIYAYRGIGKTHVALQIAFAVAVGGTFINWKAEKPMGVLYLDGEMPAISLQERLALIVESAEQDFPDDSYLRFLTPDFTAEGMPDLGTVDGQQKIDSLVLDTTKLIIVDNLSSLVRSGRENESEGWLPVQAWALKHRAAGRSVLFIHHAGKSGGQRGTSKREDLLDVVIALKRPEDYKPSEGARFELHFEKARHLLGDDVEPIDCQLSLDKDGGQTWLIKPLPASNYQKVVSLTKDGLRNMEIAEKLGLNKSTISNYRREAREKVT
jgi:DNA-binding CsgD family transcriptional regulator